MHLSDITETGIALDIDETLSATGDHWAEILNETFGNPENLSVAEIIKKYRYASHVPYWQTPEALAWMENARHSDEFQGLIPLIENSNHIANKLKSIVPISAYITVRPESVRSGTMKWLAKHGFPKAPIIMRPADVLHVDGNKWKAEILTKIYPKVWGIIDDNPRLITYLPDDYQGTVFLYDHEEIDTKKIHIIPVKKWEDMITVVTDNLRS
ncbi:MAG: hypothetical protein WBO66_00605 [Candidatus Moraniibacteriota bacterium]